MNREYEGFGHVKYRCQFQKALLFLLAREYVTCNLGFSYVNFGEVLRMGKWFVVSASSKHSERCLLRNFS